MLRRDNSIRFQATFFPSTDELIRRKSVKGKYDYLKSKYKTLLKKIGHNAFNNIVDNVFSDLTLIKLTNHQVMVLCQLLEEIESHSCVINLDKSSLSRQALNQLAKTLSTNQERATLAAVDYYIYKIPAQVDVRYQETLKRKIEENREEILEWMAQQGGYDIDDDEDYASLNEMLNDEPEIVIPEHIAEEINTDVNNYELALIDELASQGHLPKAKMKAYFFNCLNSAWKSGPSPTNDSFSDIKILCPS